MWIADAHRDGGKRFVVRADEKLTAFLKLESAIRASQQSLITVAKGAAAESGEALAKPYLLASGLVSVWK
jgi:hypothetical protein